MVSYLSIWTGRDAPAGGQLIKVLEMSEDNISQRFFSTGDIGENVNRPSF
jgi:hypothetical protein